MADWMSLYYRMKNCAAGYSNFCDESGSTRKLEREFEQIDSDARSLKSSPPVAVQEEGDAWQPIETAPKDGKEFLAIWERQGNLMQVVRWNTVHKFYQAKGEPILGFSSNATAWQPLPSPPAAMKGDQP